MQPLSRVKRDAFISFGSRDAMASRPHLAIKIAECIAEWSDLETLLAVLLAFVLDIDTDTVLAMYDKLENRGARLRMLEAALETKLVGDESKTAQAIIHELVRPAMKQRDKLAHWVWGIAPDLPDALLLTRPSEQTATHMKAIRPPTPPDFNRDQIFVVKEDDLLRELAQIREAKDYVARIVGAVGRTHLSWTR